MTPKRRFHPTPIVGLDELNEASKLAARTISGDTEWTAAQFREFMEVTRNLCNLVDRFVDQNSGGQSAVRCRDHGGYGFGADCVECHPEEAPR